MLTIKAHTSPANAERYFDEHLARDNYYADHAPGRWFGQGCQYLGIDPQAPVQKDQFVALCRGLRPDDHKKLTQRAKANRRCLYDLTLSAPKSVSIMAITLRDERLIAAHERAVTAALDAAEKLAAVRVRKGAAVDTQQTRSTGNLVSAQFLHRESRALDPQLHTHCVTFNVSYDPVEKRSKALEPRPIYDHAKALTAVYRDQLTQSLHALGYETYQDRHNCVQICGVEPALMEQFSKRAAQRNALVAVKERQLGRTLTNNEIAKLVRDKRARKQNRLDAAALRKAQLAQLSPEHRSRLERLRQHALELSSYAQPRRADPQPPIAPPEPAPRPHVTPPPRIVAPPSVAPQPYVPGPWIAALRLALLATRTLDTNPYLFSPTFTYGERVCWTVRHVQQIQRARALMRSMQRGQGISR